MSFAKKVDRRLLYDINKNHRIKQHGQNFSLEFKQQSIDYLLTNAHLSISELANHLGVGKSTLDKWVKYLALNKTSRRELTPEQQRIIVLKKENKELKMANKILKKAQVYFINNPSR